jgi:peptidoglycan/xylan/chitin deacetylase (PgdA/CDA1 family)
LRPLARTLAPGAVVLGYHRVADASWDPLGLAVSPRHFAEQVAALKAVCTIVNLGSLAERHAAGDPLERYAALTFDDGYDDFAKTVLPIVESQAVPVTVFVATGFTGKAFWWDEIAASLAPAQVAGDSLEVSRGDGTAWHYEGLGAPEKRAAAVRDLCDRLACADPREIRDVVAQLRSRAGGAAPRPGFGAMSRRELETAARHPLVEIGAHTVSHGCLAKLPESDQRAEISRSKAAIEALPGVAAAVFSYPNGSFSAETPVLLRSLGFACACTSRDGVFNRRTDRFRIPRIWTPNVDAPGFQRWLESWVAGIA